MGRTKGRWDGELSGTCRKAFMHVVSMSHTPAASLLLAWVRTRGTGSEGFCSPLRPKLVEAGVDTANPPAMQGVAGWESGGMGLDAIYHQRHAHIPVLPVFSLAVYWQVVASTTREAGGRYKTLSSFWFALRSFPSLPLSQTFASDRRLHPYNCLAISAIVVCFGTLSCSLITSPGIPP
jgi:hypothetical protein